MTKNIIEPKPRHTYETRGEWFDRLGRNAAHLPCLLAIILSVVGAVAHIASQMWANFALDFIVMVVFSLMLSLCGKEEEA